MDISFVVISNGEKIDKTNLVLKSIVYQSIPQHEIILCGHYDCGGIKAALENHEHGIIDNWLRHIKDVIRFNTEKFEGLDHEKKLDLLCEMNVKEQVTNICNTTIVQKAWKNRKDLTVHGWIYSIKNGVLKHLVTHDSASKV